MQHIDVNKKRPARWPWLLGAGLLVLVLWGVTILLRTEPEPEEPAAVTTAGDTLPPAVIPSDTRGSAPRPDSGEGQAGSLTEDRIGERVQVAGEIVATGDDGFWIVTGSQVLRVESRRRVRGGDSLSLEGVLRAAESAALDGVASRSLARHPESDSWTVLRTIKLVEEEASGP